MSGRRGLVVAIATAVSAAILLGGLVWLLARGPSGPSAGSEGTAESVPPQTGGSDEGVGRAGAEVATDRYTAPEGDLSFPVRPATDWPFVSEPEARDGLDYWIMSSRPADAYRAFGGGSEGVMVSLEKIRPGSTEGSLDAVSALSTYEAGFGLTGEDGPCAEGYFVDFPDVSSPLEEPGERAGGAWDGCPNDLVERNYAFATDDGTYFVVVAVRAGSAGDAETLLREIVAGLQVG